MRKLLFLNIPTALYINSHLNIYYNEGRSDEIVYNDYYYGDSIKNVKLLRGKETRLALHLKKLLKGADLGVLCQVVFWLILGVRYLYLSTVTDLGRDIRWIKKLFPRLRIMTVQWSVQGVRSEIDILLQCDWVMCLTKGSYYALKSIGVMKDKISLEILGMNINCNSEMGNDFDVCLTGTSNRHFQLMIDCFSKNPFRVASTAQLDWLYRAYRNIKEQKTDWTLVRCPKSCFVWDLLSRSVVTWITLIPQEIEPHGYTNMMEALLCGTGVIISSESILPDEILNLEGVYKYEPGNEADLVYQTHKALKELRVEGVRERIRLKAREVFNGNGIKMRLQTFLDNSQQN